MNDATRSDRRSPPAPGEMLCFSIYSAHLAFNRLYKPLLEPLGLTYPQYLAMIALWRRDGLTVGGVGAELGLESNTLTPLLKRLESLGYVRRERDPEDERQVRVRLTESGAALAERACGVPADVGAALGMSAAEAKALVGEIARLRERLERGADQSERG